MRRCVRNSKGAGARGGREKVMGEVAQVAGALLAMNAFFKLTGTYFS